MSSGEKLRLGFQKSGEVLIFDYINFIDKAF